MEEAFDVVIIGIILFCYRFTLMLFDPRSTFSYVAIYFAFSFGVACQPLAMPFHVSTLIGDSLVVDQMYLSSVVTFIDCETWVNSIVLDMVNFGVILGMYRLAPYHYILDYHAKIVTLATLGVPRFAWKVMLNLGSKDVISFLCVCRVIEKGCLSYLAHIMILGLLYHLL